MGWGWACGPIFGQRNAVADLFHGYEDRAGRSMFAQCRVHSGPPSHLKSRPTTETRMRSKGGFWKTDGIATVIDEQDNEKTGTRYKEVITLLLFAVTVTVTQ